MMTVSPVGSIEHVTTPFDALNTPRTPLRPLPRRRQDDTSGAAASYLRTVNASEGRGVSELSSDVRPRSTFA